jgi:seryl-tRNA synthetase
MLDIKFIRENSKLVKEKSIQKGFTIDIDNLLKVDEQHAKPLLKNEMKKLVKN